MPMRLLIAYALIALLVAGAGLLCFHLSRERRSRRRIRRIHTRWREAQRARDCQERSD